MRSAPFGDPETSMLVVAIDTLKVARKIKAGGFEDTQAEVLAETISETITEAVGELEKAQLEKLATKKGDIKNIELQIKEVKARITEVEAKLEIKIAEIKLEAIKWVAGLLFLQSGLVIGAMFTMFRVFLSGP